MGKIKLKVQKKILGAAIATVVSVPAVSAHHNHGSDDKPKQKVSYQVDTLVLDDYVHPGAYYNYATNSITMNYFKGVTNRSKAWIEGVLYHELKHRENYRKGIWAYALSLEDAYKVQMHDEISAHLANLIAAREVYIKTGNIEDIIDMAEDCLFYRNAIVLEQIDPKSSDKEDFEKEMAFIADGIQKMWMKYYADHPLMMEECAGNGATFYDVSGKYAPFYEANYKRALKIMYHVGGIDFSKYLKKDVQIPEGGKKMLYQKMYENYEVFPKISHREFAETMGLPVFDGSMSVKQYYNLLQHRLIADYVVPALQEESVQKADDEAIRKIIGHARQHAAKQKAFLNRIAYLAAKEYKMSGKKLPKDNDAAYGAAIEGTYVGALEFYGMSWIDLDKKLPLRYRSDMGYTKENIRFAEENPAVNPPNYIKPTYRDYRDEDGSRVSEVQNIELLDLSKHIIKIPRAKNDVMPKKQNFKEQNKTYNRAAASKYARQRGR